jgi:cysteine-rich repeat protein
MHGRAKGFWIAVAVLGAVACGGEDAEENGADAGSMDAGGGGATDAGAGDADGADGGMPEPPASWCGDGVQDELEQCDDGNNSEWDGCNTLCEFTCEQDRDCDDLDVCNGVETCKTAEHTCESSGDAEDGVRCGDLMSCNTGVCLPNSCGDEIEQQGEECDDGDLDDDNGCTAECEFTCVSDEAWRDCSNADPCAAPAVCNDDSHQCEQIGSAAADETICDDGAGWCMKGVCVPANCGDGERTGSEECDDGADNGEPSRSDCSIDCQFVECGDG